MSSTGVPAITTSAPSDDGNTAATIPEFDPNHDLFGVWSAEEVPERILEFEVENAILFADVLHSGAGFGSGLTSEEARIQGKSKNHWVWRFTFKFINKNTRFLEAGGMQFGMEMADTDSVGSNAARYTPSSSGRLFKEGTFSGFTHDKAAPPAWSAASVPSDTSSNKGGSCSSGSEKFSDVSDQNYPASIQSNDGRFIQQPGDGVPHPASFTVRCGNWLTASHAALVTFRFKLRPGTTFRHLLVELQMAKFEPFFFRKSRCVFLGCRDFISQAAAVWLTRASCSLVRILYPGSTSSASFATVTPARVPMKVATHSQPSLAIPTPSIRLTALCGAQLISPTSRTLRTRFSNTTRTRWPDHILASSNLFVRVC